MQAEECQICITDLNKSLILQPCNHVLCDSCARQLSGEKCPFCRGTVSNWPARTITDSIIVENVGNTNAIYDVDVIALYQDMNWGCALGMMVLSFAVFIFMTFITIVFVSLRNA